MYRSVCLLALFIIVAYGARNDGWKAINIKCANETEVDPRNIEKHFEDGAPDDKWRCFMACTWMRIQTLTKNGALNYEVPVRDLPKDIPESVKLIEASRKRGRSSKRMIYYR